MYNEKTRLGEVLKNPFGKDVLTLICSYANIDPAMLTSPITKAMTLKSLSKLSKGMLDDKLISTLCGKLNEYADMPEVKHPENITEKWWKSAVFYQIYPCSFCDANGDGIGDIRGIISKLDYLAELGVTALWLSPIYPSPWDDNGYDIKDYRNIRKEFGTLDDFDEMLSGAHKRGIRVILDLVVNHSSDEHKWFEQAKMSEDNEYRDYYIWRKQPNNWQSMFSGSAWEYSPETDSYYLHCFSKKQVDLNWKNEKVRKEVAGIVNFWYDRGVDGFRLDVINMIDKPDDFPDGNEKIGELGGMRGVEYYLFGSRAHKWLHEMNLATTVGRDVFTVGETPGVGMELARCFTAEQNKELDMVFSFEHLFAPGTSRYNYDKYDLNHLKNNLTDWQMNYGNACWPSLFLDNHDNPRMLSRTDSREEYRTVLAKLLATIQLTLKGTPFIFEGQELGMTNSDFKTIGDFRDVEAINYYNEHKSELPEQELLRILNRSARDHARTPVQWSTAKNAGFTSGTPWLDVNANYNEINAEVEATDPDSVLSYYKKLVALRKATPALVYGEFAPLTASKKDLFCYTRTLDGVQYYIECNLSDGEMKRPVKTDAYEHVIGNCGQPTGTLRAYEANIYKRKK